MKILAPTWNKDFKLLDGSKLSYKIADKITKVSRNLQQNNSQTVTNENDKKIHKERYISPEKREEVIDDLRLI